MKVRILKKNDGTLSVVHPIPSSRRKGESEEIWLKRVFDKATPEETEYEDIEKDKIPNNKRFRKAWKFDVDKVDIDIPKAKEQLLVELRIKRDGKLKLTDADILKINEIGSDAEKNKIKNKRQKLRDLPVSFSSKIERINTIKGLEAIDIEKEVDQV